eukprot:TRINITY_DN66890_c5_g3_i1.p1 TRINITY_DN66890_c5_g3~~TRINITY_DN66890_c5_g3_i1.p1  ORF type:complete len:281 (+),score=135.69 TRINITY_DN66890_c5_g3_i1:106-948(+)
MRDLYATDGVRGYFRGLSAPVVGAMAENAIVFAVYSKACRVLERHMTSDERQHADRTGFSPYRHVAMGGVTSGVAVAFWLTPVEFVKVRLQAKHMRHMYNGPIDCIVKSAKSEGIASFFKGHAGTLLRESIGGGVYFAAYDLTCRAFTSSPFLRRLSVDNSGKNEKMNNNNDNNNNDNNNNNDDHALHKDKLHPLATMAAGAAAGTAYWTAIFPFDTLKSQMQANNDSAQRESYAQASRRILRAGGIRAFYPGLTITALRAAPSNAVIFLVYEQLRALMG